MDSRLRMTGGLLLVLAALLLSGPGVEIARAGDGPVPSAAVQTESPAVCEASNETPRAEMDPTVLGELILQFQRSREAASGPHSDANIPIVLNNAGYSYQLPARVDPAAQELKKLGLE